MMSKVHWHNLKAYINDNSYVTVNCNYHCKRGKFN